MKTTTKTYNIRSFRIWLIIPLAFLMIFNSTVFAQDEGAELVEVVKKEKKEKDNRPIRSTFDALTLIDNQSVMVGKKNTLTWDIQHRFGTVNNGYEDMIGLFAASNIRLGFVFTPIDNFAIGFGSTKNSLLWDFSAKYAIVQQARQGGMPLSITAYVNLTVDGRINTNSEIFENKSDRLSYFYEIIIAHKLNKIFSFQIAPNLSHFNIIDGDMKNDHFGLNMSGQIKFKKTGTSALIFEIDQPLSGHDNLNPHPNLSLGYQVSTSSHTFQLFIGNYNALNPQYNNVKNINDYRDWDFLIGFNITRNWNF